MEPSSTWPKMFVSKMGVKRKIHHSLVIIVSIVIFVPASIHLFSFHFLPKRLSAALNGSSASFSQFNSRVGVKSKPN